MKNIDKNLIYRYHLSKKLYIRDWIFDIFGACYIHFSKERKGL